jgi:hypothetical protein
MNAYVTSLLLLLSGADGTRGTGASRREPQAPGAEEFERCMRLRQPRVVCEQHRPSDEWPACRACFRD